MSKIIGSTASADPLDSEVSARRVHDFSLAKRTCIRHHLWVTSRYNLKDRLLIVPS